MYINFLNIFDAEMKTDEAHCLPIIFPLILIMPWILLFISNSTQLSKVIRKHALGSPKP